MSKYSNYIILKYNPNGYEIIIVTENKKVKLTNKNAEIMKRVLNNFKQKQINEDTYIYPNLLLIMIAFNREKNKLNQKHVNRKKSKKISICILLTASLAIGGAFAYKETLKKENQKKNHTTESELEIDSEEVFLENTDNINIEKTKQEVDNILEENIESEAFPKENINNNDSSTNNNFEYFNYYYETPEDQKKYENAQKYDDIFAYYEYLYGIDKTLLCAIAANESSGYQTAHNFDYSYGLMGIEKSIWKDECIDVYNFEIGDYETIKIDYDKIINDAEYCIKVGAAIYQKNFYTTIKNSKLVPLHESLAYSLQRYNMGSSRMPKILERATQNGTHWTQEREKETKGDSRYFEKVLSYFPNGTIIKNKLKDGTYFYTIISNEALEKTHSRN